MIPDGKVITQPGIYAAYVSPRGTYYKRVSADPHHRTRHLVWLDSAQRFKRKHSRFSGNLPVYFVRVMPKVRHAPTV